MLQTSVPLSAHKTYCPALFNERYQGSPKNHAGQVSCADTVVLSDLGPTAPIQSVDPAPPNEAHRQELGLALWERFQDGKIDLLPIQVSGRNDGADARSNIADTALGRQAKRSSYQNAPGGRVSLSFPLLEGLKSLSDTHTYRITALAGGSHSERSRHYLGVGLDIDMLDGVPIDIDHPRFRDFMAQARELGATEVLGPGSRGHDHHIHVAWPRDAAG